MTATEVPPAPGDVLLVRADAALALIDGALDDWAVSDDAMRWTPDAPPGSLAPQHRFSRHTPLTMQEWAAACGALEPVLGAIKAAFVQMAEVVSSVDWDALTDAWNMEDPLPQDPRERALHLRRYRNTGPDRQVQHQNRPRLHR